MNQLIYIADPMCSWCHGFSPVMTQLAEHYKNELGFSLIMGGLRPGGHTPWDQKLRNFLRHHWEEVGAKTGQPFSFDLLDKEVFKYDTEPSCRAVCVVREMASEKAFQFFKAIQYAFYYLNNDPNELDFYLPLCDELGIDKEVFTHNFLNEDYKKLTANDFKYSQSLGVRGFPTLVLSQGDSMQIVVRGYAGLEPIRAKIDEMLNEKYSK